MDVLAMPARKEISMFKTTTVKSSPRNCWKIVKNNHPPK